MQVILFRRPLFNLKTLFIITPFRVKFLRDISHSLCSLKVLLPVMPLQIFLKNNTTLQKKERKKLQTKKTSNFETCRVVAVKNAKLVAQRCFISGLSELFRKFHKKTLAMDPNVEETPSHVFLL